ncbi:antitoxin MazE-like protein [Labrys miyagiensis]|nr:antitoxin MazE-like protein [Labrys miyagiensis]
MTAAERMKAMRERRRSRDMREVRLSLPDARVSAVRKRIAAQVARLDRKAEHDALDWIEAVSEFDDDAAR